MTNNSVQIEDALREVGYRQWEDFPDIWRLPNGEGAYLTEEALYLEWQKTIRRAGRAEAVIDERDALLKARDEQIGETLMGFAAWIVVLVLVILYQIAH